MVAVAAVWVAVNVVWFGARGVHASDGHAGGYASARWYHSQLMADVRARRFPRAVYSNDFLAVSYFAGRSVRGAPARTFFASRRATGQLKSFLRVVACEPEVQLIWFDGDFRTQLYTDADLRKVVHLDPLLRRADGTIYDVKPLVGASAAC